MALYLFDVDQELPFGIDPDNPGGSPPTYYPDLANEGYIYFTHADSYYSDVPDTWTDVWSGSDPKIWENMEGLPDCSDATPSQVFSFTGGVETFTVPEHVAGSLVVTVEGGAGGSSQGSGRHIGGYGGGGKAMLQGFSAGDVITVVVGGRGEEVSHGGEPRGGAGGWSLDRPGGDGGGNAAGGGGGASELLLLGNPIIVAGGGGGGGASDGYGNSHRGGAGGGASIIYGSFVSDAEMMPHSGYDGRDGKQSPNYGLGGEGGNLIAPGAGGEGGVSYPGYSEAMDGQDGLGGEGGKGGLGHPVHDIERVAVFNSPIDNFSSTISWDPIVYDDGVVPFSYAYMQMQIVQVDGGPSAAANFPGWTLLYRSPSLKVSASPTANEVVHEFWVKQTSSTAVPTGTHNGIQWNGYVRLMSNAAGVDQYDFNVSNTGDPSASLTTTQEVSGQYGGSEGMSITGFTTPIGIHSGVEWDTTKGRDGEYFGFAGVITWVPSNPLGYENGGGGGGGGGYTGGGGGGEQSGSGGGGSSWINEVYVGEITEHVNNNTHGRITFEWECYSGWPPEGECIKSIAVNLKNNEWLLDGTLSAQAHVYNHAGTDAEWTSSLDIASSTSSGYNTQTFNCGVLEPAGQPNWHYNCDYIEAVTTSPSSTGQIYLERGREYSGGSPAPIPIPMESEIDIKAKLRVIDWTQDFYLTGVGVYGTVVRYGWVELQRINDEFRIKFRGYRWDDDAGDWGTSYGVMTSATIPVADLGFVNNEWHWVRVTVDQTTINWYGSSDGLSWSLGGTQALSDHDSPWQAAGVIDTVRVMNGTNASNYSGSGFSGQISEIKVAQQIDGLPIIDLNLAGVPYPTKISSALSQGGHFFPFGQPVWLENDLGYWFGLHGYWQEGGWPNSGSAGGIWYANVGGFFGITIPSSISFHSEASKSPAYNYRTGGNANYKGVTGTPVGAGTESHWIKCDFDPPVPVEDFAFEVGMTQGFYTSRYYYSGSAPSHVGGNFTGKILIESIGVVTETCGGDPNVTGWKVGFL